MKRLLLLLTTTICMFFFAGSTAAKPKTRQQAQRDVEAFLSQRGNSLKIKAAMARSSSGQDENSQESLYFFDVEGGKGFVIASGSDNTPAILGYTDSGSYDEESLPKDMKWWLEGYKQQIEYANRSQQAASVSSSLVATRAALPNHAKIAPMLTTKWDQEYPYNLKCPSSGFTTCVTGCGATAIAQIMYYHRKNSIRELPRELVGYRYKNSNINVYTFPKGSTIDWDNMLDSYSNSFYGGETNAQKNAVAYLMAYLGSAMKMKYGTEASSSNLGNVRTALINFFNYSETMTTEEREDYSDTEWDNLIYSELAAGRPVNYTGIAVDGEEKSGHSFVCDGYDGNGYYHINWGWGGTADGCFLLSALNPKVQGIGGSSSAYNTEHEILIGIVPKDLKYADYEAYAAKNNGTLTFYYDQQRASRGEDTYDMEKIQTTTLIYVNPRPNWNDSYDEVTDITKVKFDRSFSSWHPTSTYYWFYWFSKLTSIDGMENLNAQYIKNQTYMFGNCESLKEVELPANLRMIDGTMFYRCKSLKSVSIPAGVSSIGNYAFWDCTSLSTITSKIPNPFAINSNTFPSAIYSTATLKVPAGKKSLYQSTNGWNLFRNIEEMAAEVVKPTYTLKYIVDGVDYKVLTLYEGDMITPEPQPSKSGYTFSGWSSIPSTMPAYDVTITGTFKKTATAGDANGDGYINDDDVKAISAYIIGNTPHNFDLIAADANQDKKVNVADIVTIIGKIRPDTGKDPTPVTPNDGDIETDMITASFTGGAYFNINGRIQSGSKLNVKFSNKSSKSVTLTKMQLNDAETGSEGYNMLSEEVVVPAGQDVSYTITVGLLGISKPVIIFTYKYNNKTYQVKDEWKEIDFPKIDFPDLNF